MAMLLALPPRSPALDTSAIIVWSASTALLAAVRAGDRRQAEEMGTLLVNTREDRRCTPARARVIDSTMEIALRAFGGTAPAFQPAQPDDGEVA